MEGASDLSRIAAFSDKSLIDARRAQRLSISPMGVITTQKAYATFVL
jgi:hypothetical protein